MLKILEHYFFLNGDTGHHVCTPLVIYAKDSGKLKLDGQQIAEFWRETTERGWLDGSHPGKPHANPIGLYGDDAKYTKSGEKFINICWNCLLHEPNRYLNPLTIKTLYAFWVP